MHPDSLLIFQKGFDIAVSDFDVAHALILADQLLHCLFALGLNRPGQLLVVPFCFLYARYLDMASFSTQAVSFVVVMARVTVFDSISSCKVFSPFQSDMKCDAVRAKVVRSGNKGFFSS